MDIGGFGIAKKEIIMVLALRVSYIHSAEIVKLHDRSVFLSIT